MRLLEQARRLIANQGFKETSMAQIAQACQVTKATLYHYFKSKEDMLMAILGCHQEHLETLKSQLGGAKDLEEILLLVGQNHLDRMSQPDQLDFVKILVNEAMTNPEVKNFYMDFIKQSLLSAEGELLTPYLKGRKDPVEIRRTYFQFIAALAHYTWQVKMVGSLSDIIGEDDAYIRLLAKVYSRELLNG